MAIRTHHARDHIEVTFTVELWRKMIQELNTLACTQGGPLHQFRTDLGREIHKYDERVRAASRVYGNGEPEPPIPVSDEEIDHRLGG